VKVLLDEDVPHKLRLALTAHDVSTVVYMGWGGLKNGRLLRTAEAAGFEVFVTCDKKLDDQQNRKVQLVGVVLLSAQEWPTINQHLEEISRAVDVAVPGSFQVVACGASRRS
jgi:hypothetical protein